MACHGDEGVRRTAAKPRAKRGRSRAIQAFGFEEMKLDTLRQAHLASYWRSGPQGEHRCFINIRTRKVYIAGISQKPDRKWVVDAARSVSFLFQDNTKKLLVRDGDGKFSQEFDELFKEFNMTVKKLPYRSPNLNPYAEGFVGTIRRECLDHFFVFGQEHFKYLTQALY